MSADEQEEPEAQKAVSARKEASQSATKMTDDEEMPKKKKPKKAAATSMKEAGLTVNAAGLDYVTKQEVADAINAVMGPMMTTINSLTQSLESVTKELNELRQEDAVKIAQTKEVTPSMSLIDLIHRGNVIGKDATRIDGRTVKAKEGPVETEAPVSQRTMIPFVNNIISKNGQASA